MHEAKRGFGSEQETGEKLTQEIFVHVSLCDFANDVQRFVSIYFDLVGTVERVRFLTEIATVYASLVGKPHAFVACFCRFFYLCSTFKWGLFKVAFAPLLVTGNIHFTT